MFQTLRTDTTAKPFAVRSVFLAYLFQNDSMKNKIRLDELRTIVEQVLNETPYDEIDFGFLDREDEERNSLKTKASEEFYNRMAKDTEILKQVYHSMLDTQNKEKAKDNFRNLQVMNRVENHMEELYKNPEYTKLRPNRGLLGVYESTFDKFFDDAYEAALKRHNR